MRCRRTAYAVGFVMVGHRRRLLRLWARAAVPATASGLKSVMIRPRRPSLFLPSSCVTQSPSKASGPGPGPGPGPARSSRQAGRRTSILEVVVVIVVEEEEEEEKEEEERQQQQQQQECADLGWSRWKMDIDSRHGGRLAPRKTRSVTAKAPPRPRRRAQTEKNPQRPRDFILVSETACIETLR